MNQQHQAPLNQEPIHQQPVQPPAPGVTQPEPEKELYRWEAQARPFKRRTREFYSTVAAFVILLSLILLFAKEFLLIGVILSMGFLAYVLASVPPGNLTNSLTNKGVRTAGKVFYWQEMSRYWWEEKWKQTQLSMETPFHFPAKVVLLVPEKDKAAIDKIMKKYVIEETPEPTWSDKAAQWLQDKIPLETS